MESRVCRKNPKPALLIIGGLGNKPPDRSPNVDRLPATSILSHPRRIATEAGVAVPLPVWWLQPSALQSGTGAPDEKDATPMPSISPVSAHEQERAVEPRTAADENLPRMTRNRPFG